MSDTTTQLQAKMATLMIREVSCKLELLNESFNVLDTLTSKIIDGSITLTNNISSGSSTISTNNLSRLSGTVTFLLKEDLATDYFKIALNTRCRIYMTLTNPVNSDTADYLLGTCLFNSPVIKRTNEASGTCIEVDLNDLMSLYNGDLGGQLVDAYTYDEGADVTNAIKSVATDSDLMDLDSDYVSIEANTLELEEDLSIDAGSTIQDILVALVNEYMGYEAFFDRYGIFTYREIPSASSDSSIAEYNNSPLITNYTLTNDFTNVANKVTVLGGCEEDETDSNYGEQYIGSASITDTSNPLHSNNIGLKLKVITDDTQQSNSKCRTASKYFLSLYSNYAQKLELTMLPDYRLIPNRVITVAYDEDDNFSIDKGRYLISSVNFNFKHNELATVTCYKIYDN